LVLQAAGLRILLVDDREALAKVEPMFERRDPLQVRSGHFWKGGKRKRTRPKKGQHPVKTAAAVLSLVKSAALLVFLS
jgi:hypothetical protein